MYDRPKHPHKGTHTQFRDTLTETSQKTVDGNMSQHRDFVCHKRVLFCSVGEIMNPEWSFI